MALTQHPASTFSEEESMRLWRERGKFLAWRTPAVVRRMALLIGGFGVAVSAWAQTEPGTAEGAAACAACGAMTGFVLLLPILFFALNIALLVWVARDAKSRGMDNSVLWMILVLFTSVIGLVIYMFSRPQGELVQCPHCKNRRLKVSAKCPHCGNS